MIAIEKLSPGMEVYDVHSEQAGNTTMRRIGVWPVRIVSVDVERGVVTAHWNGNPARSFYARRGKFPWRKDEPIMVQSSRFTMRIETREEKKTRLAKVKK